VYIENIKYMKTIMGNSATQKYHIVPCFKCFFNVYLIFRFEIKHSIQYCF